MRFVHAIERFQGMGIAVDERRGSLRDNVLLTRAHKVVDWRRWWAETIAFDALIANTDRHSENWGFLVDQSVPGDASYSLAPAFDNGTSLGFLIREPDLPRFTKPAKLAQFIARENITSGGYPESVRALVTPISALNSFESLEVLAAP
jgi:hypothetical protein